MTNNFTHTFLPSYKALSSAVTRDALVSFPPAVYDSVGNQSSQHSYAVP